MTAERIERSVGDDVDLLIATVHRAEPTVRGDIRHSAAIHIATDIPPDDDPSLPYELTVHYERWQDDAKAIHDALVHACPGGTLDALFALMAAERASAYVVRTRFGGGADLLRGLVEEVRALVECFGGDATRPAARVDAAAECWGCHHPKHEPRDCTGEVQVAMEYGPPSAERCGCEVKP